jgi:hypothetical protein
MQLLWRGTALLLDMSLWVSDLKHMYGGESMGFYVQWDQLAVP